MSQYFTYNNYLSDQNLGMNEIETYENKPMQKYIIYKGTGGLIHNLKGLSFAIKIAIEQKRILIIDMNKHPAFGTSFSRFFDANIPGLVYFDNYNYIPTDLYYFEIPLEDIKNISIKFTQNGYFLKTYNISDKNISDKQQVVVYAGTGDFHKYLFNIKINAIYYRQLMGEISIKSKYISVHFRNTDIQNNIYNYITKIQQIINKTGINNLYLATDDHNAYDIFKQNLKKVVIHRKNIPPKVKKNLHYEEKNKEKLFYSLILDMFFILKSDYFLPSINSGVSQYLIQMIEKNKYLIPGMISYTKIVK
jgi:hypothetical protein